MQRQTQPEAGSSQGPSAQGRKFANRFLGQESRRAKDAGGH